MDDVGDDGADAGFADLSSLNLFNSMDDGTDLGQDDTGMMSADFFPSDLASASGVGMDSMDVHAFFNDIPQASPQQHASMYGGAEGTMGTPTPMLGSMTPTMGGGGGARSNAAQVGGTGAMSLTPSMAPSMAIAQMNGSSLSLDVGGAAGGPDQMGILHELPGTPVVNDASSQPTLISAGATPGSARIKRQRSSSSLQLGELSRVGEMGAFESKPGRDTKQLREALSELVVRLWRRAAPANVFVDALRKVVRELEKGAAPEQLSECEFDFELQHVLVTVLLQKAVVVGATSTRIISYLRKSLVVGLVSPRVMLKALVDFTMQSELPQRVQVKLATLVVRVLLWYNISDDTPNGLLNECYYLLWSLAFLLRAASTSHAVALHTSEILANDRMMALVRAAGRRAPDAWAQVDESISALSASQASMSTLQNRLQTLRNGLSANFDQHERRGVAGDGGGASGEVLDWLLVVGAPVLGQNVAKMLRAFWTEKEPEGGDAQSLLALERAACNSQTSSSLREKVNVCELLVYKLSTSSSPNMSWRPCWESLQRLFRMLRDALSQIKPKLRTEYSSLIIACAVVGACALVLERNGEKNGTARGLAECSDELSSFAISYLEEVVAEEEVLDWRSLGVWLLLLASRCGNFLRLSECDHVRAAAVLRTWVVLSGTSPSPKTSNTSSTTAMSPFSAHNEGTASLVTETAIAVIDASDTAGADGTLRSLCADLVT